MFFCFQFFLKGLCSSIIDEIVLQGINHSKLFLWSLEFVGFGGHLVK
jgi:hypothetical protein